MNNMNRTSITFIGGGNMGRALIGGLLKGESRPEHITVADPDAQQRRSLEAELGVNTVADGADALGDARVIVLAIKPQIMDPVLDGLAAGLDDASLVISIAAGIPIDRIASRLGGHNRIVRCMPNTPALYGAGITGLVAAAGVNAEDRALAEKILAAAGAVVWVENEAQMDAVTAVSGSGPAYFFLLVEALAQAGQRAGLTAEVALELARHTALGAGIMLTESGLDPAELRRRVTSPGGTTAAALDSFAGNDFSRIVDEAVTAAVKRGQALGAGE